MRADGVGKMQTYRVYWFDGDSHVEQAEWIEAADDKAAIRTITDRAKQADWELWRGKSRIAASTDKSQT